jgi:hypothetical protein
MLRIIIQIIFHSFFSVPPALFHDGKYMKENPNADVSREGTITPRQIVVLELISTIVRFFQPIYTFNSI